MHILFSRLFYLQIIVCSTGCLLFLSPALSGTIQYTYDDLNRVIRVDYANGSSVDFTYDDAGNRLTKTQTTASITGQIFNKIGNPIADVCVNATAIQCGTGVGSGRTDADGTYSMTLPAGEYYLSTDVTCGNSNPLSYYVDVNWTGNGGTLDCTAAEGVTVVNGQVSQSVDFSLEKGGIITGILYQEDGTTPITGKPDMGVAFYTGNPCTSPVEFDSIPVDPVTGRYQSYALPADSYYLRVYPGSSHYMADWWADPASIDECSAAQSVPVVIGQTTPDKDFQLGSDSDGDGLSDALENASCTDANDADSDDDGIIDGIEDANHNGQVDAGETDPCNVDSDGDGIQDGTEIGLTMADIGPDTDLAVFIADQDPASVTDPLNPDTDNDGIPDGQEDANHNGRVDNGETDPLDSRNNTGSKFFIFKSSNGKTIIINL